MSPFGCFVWELPFLLNDVLAALLSLPIFVWALFIASYASELGLIVLVYLKAEKNGFL